jgi:hypothetical protein
MEYEHWARMYYLAYNMVTPTYKQNRIYLGLLSISFNALNLYYHINEDEEFEIIDNINWKIGPKLTEATATPDTKIKSFHCNTNYQLMEYNTWKIFWENEHNMNADVKYNDRYHVQKLDENYQGKGIYRIVFKSIPCNIVTFEGFGDAPNISIPTGIITPDNCPGHVKMDSFTNIRCRLCGLDLRKEGV